MLSIRSVLFGSILCVYSSSYYTVVAGIFVPSAAFCRIIHGEKSVRCQGYSQALAILPTVTHPSHANLICARAHLHMCGQGFPAL